MQTKELSITKKNFWDRNAARYDRFMRKNAIAYDQLYALLRPAVWHKTVLEVATGTGQVAKHLLCSADHIEATDVSAAMIAQAKRGNFSSKLYFSVQDMFHLPYADQSFDVVIVSNALHIVSHPVIHEQDLQHEELLACYPYKWAQLVKSIIEQGV